MIRSISLSFNSFILLQLRVYCLLDNPPRILNNLLENMKYCYSALVSLILETSQVSFFSRNESHLRKKQQKLTAHKYCCGWGRALLQNSFTFIQVR